MINATEAKKLTNEYIAKYIQEKAVNQLLQEADKQIHHAAIHRKSSTELDIQKYDHQDQLAKVIIDELSKLGYKCKYYSSTASDIEYFAFIKISWEE